MRELHLHELISQSLDEALSAEESRLLRTHLQTCNSCQVAWTQLHALDTLLKREPPALPSDGFAERVLAQAHAHDARRSTRRYIFSVGALALAATIGLTVTAFSVVFYPVLWAALLDLLVSVVALTATLVVLALAFVRALEQVLGANTLFALTLFALALTALWTRVAFGNSPFARPIPISEV